jgi:hypothetical protein
MHNFYIASVAIEQLNSANIVLFYLFIYLFIEYAQRRN